MDTQLVGFPFPIANSSPSRSYNSAKYNHRKHWQEKSDELDHSRDNTKTRRKRHKHKKKPSFSSTIMNIPTSPPFSNQESAQSLLFISSLKYISQKTNVKQITSPVLLTFKKHYNITVDYCAYLCANRTPCYYDTVFNLQSCQEGLVKNEGAFFSPQKFRFH